MSHKLSLMAAGAAMIIASLGTAMAHTRMGSYSEYSERPSVNYSGYQDSHGNYASLADLTRSVEGTPCGIECTEQHAQSWVR